MKRWTLAALTCLAPLAAGCAATIEDRPTRGGGPETEDPGPTGACQQSVLGAPMLRRLTRQELTQTIVDVFPEIQADWADRSELPGTEVKGLSLPNESSLLRVPIGVAEKLLEIGEEVAALVADDGHLPQILPCSTSQANAECARTFLQKYGRRLFHRSLTPAEETRYLSLFNDASGAADFKTGIKWTLVALLQSPKALYRREIGAVGQNGETTLTQHEIATQLAYTFSGTAPADDLLAKADRNELSSPDALMSEAKRLLATPAGHEVIHGLFRALFNYDRVATQADKAAIPEFKDVAQDMVDETRSFIEEVMFTRRGGVGDLLTAPYSVANARLASYYAGALGQAAPASGFGVVQRAPGFGIGLLAQGSFLARNASPNSSSPTKRGAAIYRRLFCNPIELPTNNNVGAIPPPEPQVKTTRDRYEKAHAQSEYCRTCHQKIDPLGFAFEHFDEGGRFRTTEFGLTINATGSTTVSGMALSFDGQEELARDLANEPAVTACMGSYVAHYAFGTSTNCLAEEARAKLSSGNIGLVDFAAELVRAPNFTRRKAP